MSVSMAVYLVDWDDFQERVLEAEAAEVLEEIEPIPFTDENAKAARYFMEAFDAFRRAWRSDEKLYFKEVFDALFWAWRGGSYRLMELEEGNDESSDLDAIETAIKPQTVKELASMAQRLKLEDCRPLFEKHVEGNARFVSFDEWRGYGEEWLGLLHRANVESKGIVVAVFG